ncbi:MAG: hypothetical protein K8W52_39570 [Deltaproteobacteria bacterium]|nr:hypothetical protein [Deltaproteobacteria bacterium]
MVLAALALASCNAAAPPAMTCGPDTHAVNGQCVLVDWARDYLATRMLRASASLRRDGMLDDLGRLKRAERLALDPAIATALTSPPGEIARAASVAFARLKADEPGPAPDVIALVDATGQVVAMDGVANPVAGRWSDGKGGSTWPSLAVALQRSIAIA